MNDGQILFVTPREFANLRMRINAGDIITDGGRPFCDAVVLQWATDLGLPLSKLYYTPTTLRVKWRSTWIADSERFAQDQMEEK